MKARLALLGLMLVLIAGCGARAGDAPDPQTPTLPDVAYGPHERNKLDFWRMPSAKPAPLVVFIHGGGFVAGEINDHREASQC